MQDWEDEARVLVEDGIQRQYMFAGVENCQTWITDTTGCTEEPTHSCKVNIYIQRQ